MSAEHNGLKQIKLWPENHKRLAAIMGKAPVLDSLNKTANMVLAFSLHHFERNLDWVTQIPKKGKR